MSKNRGTPHMPYAPKEYNPLTNGTPQSRHLHSGKLRHGSQKSRARVRMTAKGPTWKTKYGGSWPTLFEALLGLFRGLFRGPQGLRSWGRLDRNPVCAKPYSRNQLLASNSTTVSFGFGIRVLIIRSPTCNTAQEQVALEESTVPLQGQRG